MRADGTREPGEPLSDEMIARLRSALDAQTNLRSMAPIQEMIDSLDELARSRIAIRAIRAAMVLYRVHGGKPEVVLDHVKLALENLHARKPEECA